MTQLNEKVSEIHVGGSALNVDQSRSIKIWDLPLRVFHWSLVILFVAAYITNTMGAEYFKYHVWTGYGIILLVVFRLIWGFIGTYHARFFNFVRNPLATIKYGINVIKQKDEHYFGHNPLGAIMVITLLIALLVQTISGLFGNDEIFNTGPLYGYISNELSLKFTSLHRQLFYWILGAVALHISAVLFHVFFKRDNIIKAMFTGKKSISSITPSNPDSVNTKSIGSSRVFLALATLLILSAILIWLIHTAPEAVSDLT